MKQNTLKWLSFSLILLFAFSCTKEKAPVFEPEPPHILTKYEKLVGTYKVYDTLGNYLYPMSIDYTDTTIGNWATTYTIYFSNFENQFNFSEFQGAMSNPPIPTIDIGYHGPLYDTLNKRWKIIGHYDPTGKFDNIPSGDTLRLIYRKININYYIEDLTPYKDTIIKIVAVKQH